MYSKGSGLVKNTMPYFGFRIAANRAYIQCQNKGGTCAIMKSFCNFSLKMLSTLKGVRTIYSYNCQFIPVPGNCLMDMAPGLPCPPPLKKSKQSKTTTKQCLAHHRLSVIIWFFKSRKPRL